MEHTDQGNQAGHEGLKWTPLHEEHVHCGAKMVGFAGWHMPVEYAGLRREHLCVRAKVGLFDVSHMGEIRVRGPQALPALEWLTTNYVGRLKSGQAQYSLLPNDKGGLVDDIIVYCLQPGSDYLLCVNAANHDTDLAWILKNNRGAEISDESSRWGQIAVQGPDAASLVSRIFGESVTGLAPFEFRELRFGLGTVLAARTGYTGEDGFELFVPWTDSVTLWRQLLEQGASFGVEPIGLGARDTLRTEMKYPLYGHEIDSSSNPFAAGLGWVVKPDKKSFIGCEAILDGRDRAQKHLVGFKMIERGIARQGYKLFSFDNAEIGLVTSGTPSPSLNENIGIAYVNKECSDISQRFNVDIRGRLVQAEVVRTPFVSKKNRSK